MAKYRKKIIIHKHLSIIYFIIGIFFISNLVSIHLTAINNQKEYEKLNKTYQKVQVENEKTIEEYNNLKNEDYLVRYARENYIFMKDGETVKEIYDYSEE